MTSCRLHRRLVVNGGSASVAFVTVLMAFTPSPVAGAVSVQSRLTVPEALRLAFPEPAEVERRTAFLDEAQLNEARALAGEDVEINQSVVTYYIGWRADGTMGVAYFDSHKVRTMPEVLMIVVSPEARIERVETLKFSEPPEYLASDSWYEQFEGKKLKEDLSLKGSIINMTGATLTSVAVTRAARRVLALHRVIRPFAGEEEDGNAR